MKYSRIVAEFYSKIWAIREETLTAMDRLIRLQASGVKWTAEEIRQRIARANAESGYVAHEDLPARFLAFDDEPMPMLGANGKRSSAKPGSVAVIPMTGIISHRMSMMSEISGGGGGSIQSLTAQFRQALDDGNCKAIVFDVDSPGGSVEGVMELASEIYEARKIKPITAVFNAMGCSAAYWLASAASECVCTPSGQCGSIGVYMMMQDESEALKNEGIKITLIKAGKYKAEGHPSEPLSDDARAFLQSQVDSVYGMFVKAVAQQRGTSQAAVREGFGQGRSLLAPDAVKAKLADRTGTLDDVLEGHGIKKGSARSNSRAEASAVNAGAAPPCGCACDACKACTGTGSNATSDGEACACNCEACKACDYKGAKSRAALAKNLVRGMHNQVCMACGAQATNGAVDFRELVPVNGFARWHPIGIRYGCDAHRQFSTSILLDGTVQTAAPNDDEEDENDDKCPCGCKACQGCTGTGGTKASDGSCTCACDACKACSYKSEAKGVLVSPALTEEERKKREAATAGHYLIELQRRRRQLQLL